MLQDAAMGSVAPTAAAAMSEGPHAWHLQSCCSLMCALHMHKNVILICLRMSG